MGDGKPADLEPQRDEIRSVRSTLACTGFVRNIQSPIARCVMLLKRKPGPAGPWFFSSQSPALTGRMGEKLNLIIAMGQQSVLREERKAAPTGRHLSPLDTFDIDSSTAPPAMNKVASDAWTYLQRETIAGFTGFWRLRSGKAEVAAQNPGANTPRPGIWCRSLPPESRVPSPSTHASWQYSYVELVRLAALPVVIPPKGCTVARAVSMDFMEDRLQPCIPRRVLRLFKENTPAHQGVIKHLQAGVSVIIYWLNRLHGTVSIDGWDPTQTLLLWIQFRTIVFEAADVKQSFDCHPFTAEAWG